MKKLLLTLLVLTLCSCTAKKMTSMDAQSNTASTCKAPNAQPMAMMDEKTIMKAWEKAGMIGEEHKVLQDMKGVWMTKTTATYAPDKKPEVTNGSVVMTPMLGGKFMESRYTGKMMGKTFQGFGMMGYDNVAKEYKSLWADSTMTSMMTSKGQMDKATNTIAFTGSYLDPVTNTEINSRSMMKMVSKKKMMFEMFETHGGTEYKVLEIEYTKK